MNIEEAKFILQSYRPSDEDRNDPVFSDALALLETDSELQAWHAAEVEFDRMFQEKVQAIQPPAHLKASILAGMRATAQHSPEPVATEPMVAQPDTTQRSFWNANNLLAAAAVIAVLLVAGNLMNFAPASSDEVADSTLASNVQAEGIFAHLTDHFEQEFNQFDKRDRDLGALVAYLDQHNAPLPVAASLPGSLSDDQTMGCVKTTFNGHSVSMICFSTDQGPVHLYTTDMAALPAGEASELPEFFTDRSRRFYRTWEEDGKLHILANEKSEDVLKNLF